MSIFEDVWDRKDKDGTMHYFGGGRKRATLALGHVIDLKFDCAPLTEAIHYVSSIFEKFHGSAVGSRLPGDTGLRARAARAKVHAEMEDPYPLIKFLDTVLDREDWPQEDDAVFDPYPPPKVQSPRKEEEDSYSGQNSMYIDSNHSPSATAHSDKGREAYDSQPLISEDRLGYTRHNAMSSQPQPTTPQATDVAEHPFSLALTSEQMNGEPPRTYEANRIGKRLAPGSADCATDEPKAKRPKMARRNPKQKDTTRTHAMTLRPRAKTSTYAHR